MLMANLALRIVTVDLKLDLLVLFDMKELINGIIAIFKVHRIRDVSWLIVSSSHTAVKNFFTQISKTCKILRISVQLTSKNVIHCI